MTAEKLSLSEKTEYKRLIQSLDKTQRHDLGIHLYSSLLLHSLNPRMPPRTWDAWPIDVSRVPDPMTESKYGDSKKVDFGEEVSGEELRKMFRKRGRREMEEDGKRIFEGIALNVEERRGAESDKYKEESGKDEGESDREEQENDKEEESKGEGESEDERKRDSDTQRERQSENVAGRPEEIETDSEEDYWTDEGSNADESDSMDSGEEEDEESQHDQFNGAQKALNGTGTQLPEHPKNTSDPVSEPPAKRRLRIRGMPPPSPPSFYHFPEDVSDISAHSSEDEQPDFSEKAPDDEPEPPTDSSDSDDSDTASPLVHYTPLQIKFIRAKSDYRVDLFLEMKALLGRTIRQKIQKLELSDNEGMTTNLDHTYIDEMAKTLCTRVDTLLCELRNVVTSQFGIFFNNPIPSMTWQDILLADLQTFKDHRPLSKKESFYNKMEKVLLVPPYNYKFNDMVPFPPDSFTYEKYLDSQGERKALIIEDKIRQKKEVMYKEKLFQKTIKVQESQRNASHNKGFVFKGPHKVTDAERPVFYSGTRISEHTYVSDFKV